MNDFRHQDTAEDGNTWSVVEVLAEEPDWPAVGDGYDDQGDEELQPVARSTSRCGERDAKHASIPLRRVRAGELRCEEFLYELKAGPAGGRLRRLSSAASTTARRPTSGIVTPRTTSGIPTGGSAMDETSVRAMIKDHFDASSRAAGARRQAKRDARSKSRR